MIKLKDKISQDGGQFYHEPTGRVIADYGDIGHSDLEGAEKARYKFSLDFPEFVVWGECDCDLFYTTGRHSGHCASRRVVEV